MPLVVLFWLPDFLQFLVWGRDVDYGLMAIYGTTASLWAALLSILGLESCAGDVQGLAPAWRQSWR